MLEEPLVLLELGAAEVHAQQEPALEKPGVLLELGPAEAACHA